MENAVTKDSSSLWGAGHLLSEAKFTALDYCLFAAMLVLSGVTGLYFAYRGRSRSSDVQDYLMGSRQMKTFPVAMSLIGSYVSGVTILGTPAEIYNFGTQYWLIVFSIMLSGYIVAVIYLPVYFNLRLQSSYEYLELRFDRSLRVLASIMFLLDELMFLPVVIYVPALAFNQVTGINLYIVGCSVCLLCIFYTVLGGLKAVVWTDTWQVAIMFCSVLTFAIVGTVSAGGFGNVFSKAREGNRLEFWNWSTDPFQRHTVGAILFGGTMYWTAFNAINMTMVQRYMSLPTRRKAEVSVFLFSVSAAFIISLCCYTGLLMFERLGTCDPLAAGALTTDDQLLPAYIALISNNVPGALGIFIAGVFGAALSSMSVVLNSTATVVLEDLIRGLFKRTPGPRAANAIARITATVLGLVSLAMIFVVDRLSGVLNVATSFSAIAASSMFGVFTLGMLWPWATSRGALAGAIAGALLGGWVSVGSQTVSAQGFVPPDRREPDMSGCLNPLNVTSQWRAKHDNSFDASTVFPLYKLSYHWIAPIGICTTILVGILVSYFTKDKEFDTLDPHLFSPVIHRWLPEKMMKNAGMATRKSKLIVREDIATTDLLLEKIPSQMSSRKRATNGQIEKLVAWMEERPAMATGRHDGRDGRINNKLAWRSLAVALNATEFGCEKTGEMWQQTWRDCRSAVKKKASGLRIEMGGTGGGPSMAQPLTPLEERVLAVIAPEAAYGHTATESVPIHFISESRTPSSSPSLEMEQVDVVPFSIISTDEAVPLSSTANSRGLSVAERLMLLEERREARDEAREERQLETNFICDSNLKILSVCARFGGASHDAHIWQMMAVKPYIEQVRTQEIVWLLGDSAFPLRPYMMTPVLNAVPGSQESVYTDMHCKARNCIERCFGLLKSRWRCLLKHRVLHYSPLMTIKIINACAVLHNIALVARLPEPADLRVEDDLRRIAEGLHADDIHDDNLQQGQIVRRRIVANLQINV